MMPRCSNLYFRHKLCLPTIAEGMILSLEAATVDPLGLNDTFNFRSSGLLDTHCFVADWIRSAYPPKSIWKFRGDMLCWW